MPRGRTPKERKVLPIEELNLVLDLALKGKSQKEIGNAVGITVIEVREIFNGTSYSETTGFRPGFDIKQYRKVNGVKSIGGAVGKGRSQNFVKEDIDKIIRLVLAGNSTVDVHTEMGCSKSTINSIFSGKVYSQFTTFGEGDTLQSFRDSNNVTVKPKSTVEELQRKRSESTSSTHLDVSLEMSIKSIKERMKDVNGELQAIDDEEMAHLEAIEKLDIRRKALHRFKDEIKELCVL